MNTQTQNLPRFNLTPFAAMLALTGVHSAQCFIMLHSGYPVSDGSILFYDLAFSLLVAWWVQRDRFYEQKEAPYEYLAFIFFFWFVALPWYLIQTRRWKGVWMAAGFMLLAYSPFLMEELGYYLQGSPFNPIHSVFRVTRYLSFLFYF